MTDKELREFRHRKNSCAGKYRYKTLDQADMDIDRAKELRGEELRPYECEHCGSIHLTKMTVEQYNHRMETRQRAY